MSDMTATEQMMKFLTEPLGDYAPAVRRFAIDYQQGGVDCNTEVCSMIPKGASKKALVDSFRDHIQNGGGRLSAVWEVTGGGLPDCLYVRPGFLEKSVRETGIPVPADPAAATERMGWNPVNMDELREYWSRKSGA